MTRAEAREKLYGTLIDVLAAGSERAALDAVLADRETVIVALGGVPVLGDNWWCADNWQFPE